MSFYNSSVKVLYGPGFTAMVVTCCAAPQLNSRGHSLVLLCRYEACKYYHLFLFRQINFTVSHTMIGPNIVSLQLEKRFGIRC